MLKFRMTCVVFVVALLATVAVDNFVSPVSSAIYILLVAVFITLVSLGASIISLGFFVNSRCKAADPTTNNVAITFDDGPIVSNTERVLEILKQHEAKATFFLIGRRVAEHPDIAKRIVEGGHLVGNHTYSHASTFDLKSSRSMIDEMKKTDELISGATGHKPRFFRPPYGVTNPNLAKAINRQGYTSIGWSVRSLDTVLKRNAIEKRIKKIKGGDIVLFHDYSAETLTLLDSYLTYVKSIGLQIVGLDQLINERAYD